MTGNAALEVASVDAYSGRRLRFLAQ